MSQWTFSSETAPCRLVFSWLLSLIQKGEFSSPSFGRTATYVLISYAYELLFNSSLREHFLLISSWYLIFDFLAYFILLPLFKYQWRVSDWSRYMKYRKAFLLLFPFTQLIPHSSKSNRLETIHFLSKKDFWQWCFVRDQQNFYKFFLDTNTIHIQKFPIVHQVYLHHAGCNNARINDFAGVFVLSNEKYWYFAKHCTFSRYFSCSQRPAQIVSCFKCYTVVFLL